MPKGSMPKRALVWNHFTDLTDDNGNKVNKAKCNYCDDNKVLSTKDGTNSMIQHFLNHFTRRLDKDTKECNFCQDKFKASATVRSQLLEHVDECKKRVSAAVGPSRPPAVRTPALSASGSSSMDREPARLGAQSPPDEEEGSDMDEPSRRLARMIALHGYDPSIVEDDCFKSFVESLNPEYRLPKRVIIEDACDHIFDIARWDVEEPLKCNNRGMVSFAMGKDKIMEREVVYTAYHFIDDKWNLHKMIHRLYQNGPSPYHLGKLVHCIGHICIETHLEESVRDLFVWMTTSYVRDVFMMALGITNDHSVLKGLIHQNIAYTSAAARGLVCTRFMDVMFHSVAEHLYLQINAKFREDMHSIDTSLKRHRWEEFLSHVGVDLWAYKEAWFSWYCSLVVLRNESTVVAHSEITSLLCNIWGRIYRAIETISAPKLPTSHLCLQELLNVKKFLGCQLARANGGRTTNQRGCTDFIESKDVTTVLTELMDILDTAIHESYQVWSIPFVLDPRYNLAGIEEAFRGAFGETSATYYIFMSTEKIKEVYSGYVEEKIVKRSEAEEFEKDLERAEAQVELDRYLKLCFVHPTESFDILYWWKVRGSRHYPMVAQMAKDALAMPTSSQLTSEQIAHVKSRLRSYSKVLQY